MPTNDISSFMNKSINILYSMKREIYCISVSLII